MSTLHKIKCWISPARSVFTNQQPQYKQYEIGDWTYGRPIVLDWGDGGTLKIGRFCSIARNVTILVGGEHHLDWVTTYPFPELWRNGATAKTGKSSRSKGSVLIMNDVWIGTGAIILSGVTIHNGAVIGAGSVVTGDVPAYSVVAGNPARVLRTRFQPDIIAQLQRIAWWDWSAEKIRAAWPALMSSDIQDFIHKYGVND